MLSLTSSKMLAELLGTFMITITIPLADIGIGTLAPLAVGFMLSAMCFTFGYISGAHFNPALSFSFYLSGALSLYDLIAYVIAQLVGALLAALYGNGITVNVTIPAPSSTITSLSGIQTLLFELIFSFGIVTVMLHMCNVCQRRCEFYGVVFGFITVSTGLCMGGVASGAFNPAVATASQMVVCLYDTCTPMLWCWVYWVGPVCGGILAALVYNSLNVSAPNAVMQAHLHRVY